MNLSVWLAVKSSLQYNNFMFSFRIQNSHLPVYVFSEIICSVSGKKELFKKIAKNNQYAVLCLHNVRSHHGPWVFVAVCYCSFLI